MAGKKHKGRAAWLVTRHCVSEYPKWEIAAIFNPKIGGIRVREFVELLNVTGDYTLRAQADMQWLRYGKNRTPYGAHFGQTTKGHPWEGEILCGNDPYLRARLVDDLEITHGEAGVETAVWKERPRSEAGFPEQLHND
jgi:hypothetical protein